MFAKKSVLSILISIFIIFFSFYVSADCFSRAPYGPSGELGDLYGNCDFVTCSDNPLHPPTKPSEITNWCSSTRITNCDCTNGQACGQIGILTEYFYPKDLFNQDYTPDLKNSTGWKYSENTEPKCTSCGCGTRNSEGVCVSDDPPGNPDSNNCNACSCSLTGNPPCVYVKDDSGKPGWCLRCVNGDAVSCENCDSQGNCIDTSIPVPNQEACRTCLTEGEEEVVDKDTYRICRKDLWGRLNSQGNTQLCWKEIECDCKNENKGSAGKDSNNKLACVYNEKCVEDEPNSDCNWCQKNNPASGCIKDSDKDGREVPSSEGKICCEGTPTFKEVCNKLKDDICNPKDSNICPTCQAFNYISGKCVAIAGCGQEKLPPEEPPRSFCSVGQVIYEGKDVPQLSILREIRDKVLRKNIIGNTIIAFHYSSAGSKIEHFAYSFSPIKKFMRKTLDYISKEYK